MFGNPNRKLVDRLKHQLQPEFQYLESEPANRKFIRFRHVVSGMEFVYIPAGEVMVGMSEREAKQFEVHCGRLENFVHSEEALGKFRPVRRISMPEFLISTTVVSSDLAQQAVELDEDAFRPAFASTIFVDPVKVSRPAPAKHPRDMTAEERFQFFTWADEDMEDLELHGKRPGFDDGANPIYLTRDEAEAVCSHFQLELPSESQWEYVYRAGSRTLFPWGDNLPTEKYMDEIGGYFEYDRLKTYDGKRNAFGVLSMMLTEWCADTYSPNHEDLPVDGKPRVNGESDEFVVRGGSGAEWPWRTGYEWYTAVSAMRREHDRKLIMQTAAMRLVKRLSDRPDSRRASLRFLNCGS